MSKYCFLCLSDEGVFLNITPYNYRSLCGEVESYLPVKIEGTRGKQNKVCYKCAYELKQCSDFVKRYKESRINLKQKPFGKQCCNLCLEPAKKGYIFKLNKDNDSLNNLWSTIEKLFDGNPSQIHKSPLICLTCRYILDILLDLTCLCREMSKLKEKLNNDIDYSAIPKVNTAVIKRKTTTTSFMRIKTYVINDSDSDSNISKNQSTVEMNKDSQSKLLRSCDQCKNSIKHGEDMYRFHRTGLTVCESCRGSMDLNRHNRKKNEQDTTNTKLCTVFLKDVLTDTTLKKQKTYKIEKDSDGNKVYVITESESEMEAEDKVNISKGSEEMQEMSQMRPKLRTRSDSSGNEIKRKKRMKVDKQSKFDTSKLRELPLRSSTRRTPARCNHHSDTDVLLKKSPQNSEKRGVKRRNTSVSSVSDVDTEKKSNRKKLSAILEHFIPSKDNDLSDDILIAKDSTKEKYTNENERKRKTTSSSISSTNESECSSMIKHSEHTKLSRSSVKKLKLSEKELLSNKVDENEINAGSDEKYICSMCCATYENKLIRATHELTHFKQLELKLHKINISDKLEDEQQADESNEKQLVDELAEQQNEEITLTVHDDEDIEIAGITETTKKQPEKEMCPSFAENQEDDSLKIHIINKESMGEIKVTTDTITEPIHEESTSTNEHEIKTPEETVQNLLIPTSVNNRSTCSDDIKNAQIQNGSFKSDEIENEQGKVNEATDKDKMSENENVESTENENIESTENEKIELNLEVIDEDENKENENAGDTENESVNLQQNNTEEIEHDITNKAEKDKTEDIEKDKIEDNEDKVEENEDKLEEFEKDKIEVTDIIEREQKEQNSVKNVHDKLENFNNVNAKLNDAINTDETHGDNLSQEKQNIIENNGKGDDRNETNINTVDNVTSEDNIESSIPMCNLKSTKDNCHSYEGENEQINESSTSHVEKESKCISNTKRLHGKLENTNPNEFIKIKEADVTEKAKKESTNTTTDMVENMFDLATDELDNHKNVMDQKKRYSEMKAETLEDISREIQKNADMPSLEPINSMEVDHKESVSHD